MITTGLLIVALFVALFAMVANRLAATIITAPMVFLAFGTAMAITGWFPDGETEHVLHLVAEIALVVLLFLDASQIDLTALRKHHLWPERMLLFGLPLAILFGTGVTWVFFPAWPLAALALLAALLAPTDAALGQAVTSDMRVPERVRRGLTVESGLNDGMALPAVLLFASLAAQVMDGEDRNWIAFAAGQLTLGPIAGILIGYIGGKMLLFAQDRGLTAPTFEGIGALALAGSAYLLATEIGGNGFIAAFVGGLVFGNVVKGRCKFIFEFTEGDGQLLSWAAFFLLGLVLVPEALTQLTLPMLGLILVSLFVVRPAAIWIALLRTDASPPTRFFFGWFGPRGLATALFALLIVPQIGEELAGPILAVAINTVWISALLHGISAVPGARIYADMVARKGPCPETEPVAKSFDGDVET